MICAENFDSVLEIGRFVRHNCRVDGHYFNTIRGSAKDPTLKRIPTERLPALYQEIRKVYAHYARIATRHHSGLANRIGRAYYQGVLAFHNKVQLENMESPHAWPMPCTASETSIVIDYNGDVRACELRGKLGSLRDFDCDFQEFWNAEARRNEPAAIARDQCWCTHVCFIHDSLRHSPKALLYDVPLSYLQSSLSRISNGHRPENVL